MAIKTKKEKGQMMEETGTFKLRSSELHEKVCVTKQRYLEVTDQRTNPHAKVAEFSSAALVLLQSSGQN
eukprot:5075392-Amphidinium_carterae.1